MSRSRSNSAARRADDKARHARLAAALLLGTLLTQGSVALAQQREGARESDSIDEPRRGGFVQEESVRLIVLDVRATEDAGALRRGLTRDDFLLRLDGRLWPIYSVDNLCPDMPAGGADSAAWAARSSEDATASRPGYDSGDGSSDSPRFVLYFDFSQLRQDGRLRARKAALHWIRGVHRPGEKVLVMGYSTLAGLREIEPWTESTASLERAVIGAFEDRGLLDEFPERLEERVLECRECVEECLLVKMTLQDCVSWCGQCYADAHAEYRHGKRALEMLATFLAGLEATPGRKAILLFQQNAMLFPGRMYPFSDPDFEIGTHLGLAEDVSAAAVQARAAFYAVHPGDDQYYLDPSELIPKNRLAVEMDAALAEFTGGDYSRGPSDAERHLERAGREDRCLYRVAFKPPRVDRSEVYRASITAGGRPVPFSYRVQFLSDADRSLRHARSLLIGAVGGGGLPVTAALVPIEAGRSRWSLAVQVALETGSLEIVGTQGEDSARIEVGALLENETESENWEMLAASEIHRRSAGAAGSILLYEKVLEDLRPGTYRLRVFARNVSFDQAGRAEVVLKLAAPGRGGITGPVATVASRSVYASDLPFLSEGGGEGGHNVHSHEALAPLGLGAVRRGEQLQISTWTCTEGEPGGYGERIAFIEQGGVPIFQLPEGWVEASGRCARVTDLVHTIELPPGRYTYRFGLKGRAGEPPQLAGVPLEFTITEKVSESALAAQ